MSDPEKAEENAGRGRGRLLGLTIGGVLAAGVIVLLILGLANQGDTRLIDKRIARGEAAPAPEISLPVLDASGVLGPAGSTATLAQLEGKPVLVNLWASWCEPCQDEAPVLERIWQRYRDRGLVVVGINSEDATDDALAFMRDYKVTFPMLRDPTDGTKKKFGTGQLPETFLVDADGQIRLAPIRGQLTDSVGIEIEAYLDRVLGP